MIELDEPTRRALSQRYGPQTGAKARVLGELRVQLGGPGGSGGPDESGDPGDPGPSFDGPANGSPASLGSAQLAWTAKVVAATAGLTGAGVLMLKLGAVVLVGPSDSPVSPDVPLNVDAVTYEVKELEPEQAVAVSEEHPRSAAAAELEGPKARVKAASMDSGGRSRAQSGSGSGTDTESSVDTDTGSDFAAELALLDAAERLQTSDPRAALAKLEQHRTTFAAGSLVPERETLRVLVLCALERVEEASRVCAAFLDTNPNPQLRARVESSCAGTAS